MDAIVKNFPQPNRDSERPSQQEAEEAVRVLLRWAGDDPTREGLQDTPKRVTKAFREFYSGYQEDPSEILDKIFAEELTGIELYPRAATVPPELRDAATCGALVLWTR